MKKITIIFSVLLLASSFYGCQKKSTSSLTGTGTDPMPSTVSGANSTTSVTASTTTVASSSATTDSSQPRSYQQIDSYVVEQTQVDTTFRQNYQTALADAQRALKGGAKYCGSIVKFYGAQLTSQNDQSFVFYNDDFSKDYYWIVDLNGYQDNAKLRSFTARRDIATSIKCLTAPPADPPTFASYYLRFSATDKFKMIDPGIIAQTTLSTMDTSWSVVVTDNAGAIAATEVMNVAAAGASTAPVSSTDTPTSSDSSSPLTNSSTSL